MERFARQAADALSQVLPEPFTAAQIALQIEVPPDSKLGDFAFPCFRLAKGMGKSPAEASKEIVRLLTEKGAVPKALTAASVGPYVNFTVANAEAVQALLGDILKSDGNGDYGRFRGESRGTWVVEFSSPNVAKPFMIYHFRPTGLGACLDRVGRFRGYQMVSINHLGDWGTQFGKLYVAMKMFGAELPPEPGISNLVAIYVKFHAAVETDPSLETAAREAFKRLEEKDPEVTAVWKKCIEISMREFNSLYAKLDVKFDHVWGESFYEAQLAPLLAKLKADGTIVKSEGAWVANVTDEKGRELTPCILEKSDGSTIYATRDLAAALYRYEKFKFDRMTYIVGGEQRLHFQQLFGILRKMGKDWVAKCEHVPTGLYRFKDARMSTRKGNFVTLDDVWTLVKERVAALMKERAAPGSAQNDRAAEAPSPAELAEIIDKVSIAAIVFHDLAADPGRDVDFDVERVADFEGETGPYLQYAHTRCLSILRKAAEAGTPLPAYSPSAVERAVSQLTKPEEIRLVKTLGQFPIHLERTLEHRKASQLANFLIDLVKAYGEFYRECHVLGQAKELTEARLLLVESARRVLSQGLHLLGIPLPERM